MTQKEAVARGAALLDKHRPGWETEVDPGGLRMNHCEHCVLGQLYSDFAWGCEALGIRTFDSSYGFFLDSGYYRWVSRFWRAEINKRLEVRGMDIGTEKPAITVEPIEDPFREDDTPPAREPSKPQRVREDEEVLTPA